MYFNKLFKIIYDYYKVSKWFINSEIIEIEVGKEICILVNLIR